MDRMNWLGIADNGIPLNSVRNIEVNCRMNGRDPSRLRHLDVSGVWNKDAPSMQYMFSTFNHLNRFNNPRHEFKDLHPMSPLSAVGCQVEYDDDGKAISDDSLGSGYTPSPPDNKKLMYGDYPSYNYSSFGGSSGLSPASQGYTSTTVDTPSTQTTRPGRLSLRGPDLTESYRDRSVSPGRRDMRTEDGFYYRQRFEKSLPSPRRSGVRFPGLDDTELN